MKGIKFLITVMLLGTVFSYNVKMASAASKTETLYVVADQLNVREKDSTKSKKVGSLKLGSKVKVYSQAKNGWSKIDFKKKKAYVYSKYIKKAPKNQFSRIKFFAKQGQIESTLPLKLQDHIPSVIQILGQPDEQSTSYLGFNMTYGDSINSYLNILIDSPDRMPSTEDYRDIGKNAYVKQIEKRFSKKKVIKYKDIKAVLGKADETYQDQYETEIVASYDIDYYYLEFHIREYNENDVKITDNSKIVSYSVKQKLK